MFLLTQGQVFDLQHKAIPHTKKAADDRRLFEILTFGMDLNHWNLPRHLSWALGEPFQLRHATLSA